VCAGPPESVAEAPDSHTGRYLGRVLARARVALTAEG
jgi:excinuclease UvrABC ATPase subunit